MSPEHALGLETRSTTIAVRHNIEVAHRLSLLPGKCEAIHGHSMWVDLEIGGHVDQNGLLAGLDFGSVKRAFRGHLDTEFDHHLLLNEADPLVTAYPAIPGLVLVPGDPSTENIARWIGEWAAAELGGPDSIWGVKVRVNETHVNAATYTWTKHGEVMPT